MEEYRNFIAALFFVCAVSILLIGIILDIHRARKRRKKEKDRIASITNNTQQNGK